MTIDGSSPTIPSVGSKPTLAPYQSVINGPIHAVLHENVSDEFGESHDTIHVSVQDPSEHVCAELSLLKIPEGIAGEILAELVPPADEPLRLDDLGAYSDLSSEATPHPPTYPSSEPFTRLRTMLTAAQNMGIEIESKLLGSDAEEIFARINNLSSAKTETRWKLIDRKTGDVKDQEAISQGDFDDKGKLKWLDVKMPLEYQDLRERDLTHILAHRIHSLSGLNKCKTSHQHRDFTLLETRILTPQSIESFGVDRHKLYVIISGDLLITVHDQGIPEYEAFWRLEDHSPEIPGHSVGELGIALFQLVADTDERTLRDLERKADKLNSIPNSETETRRTIQLASLSSLERAARYTERKAAETLTSLHKFSEILLGRDSTEIFSTDERSRARSEKLLQELRERFEVYRNRASSVIDTIKSDRDSMIAIAGQRSNDYQLKLAVLGALIAPVALGLSAIEAIPWLLAYYPQILIGSAATTVALLTGLGLKNRWGH